LPVCVHHEFRAWRPKDRVLEMEVRHGEFARYILDEIRLGHLGSLHIT
jgi:hypothetical protein